MDSGHRATGSELGQEQAETALLMSRFPAGRQPRRVCTSRARRVAPPQGRDRGESEPLQLAGDAFADGERGRQLGLGGGAGLGGRGQRVDRLDQEAVRGGGRATSRRLESSAAQLRYRFPWRLRPPGC
jgi:hypothetical protein